MSRVKGFRVLFATDGSVAAKAAATTAVRFPWPVGVRASGIVATQVAADYRRSLLLSALAEFVAKGATRVLSRRWPDAQVLVVDESPVEAIVREAARVRADVVVMGWRGHGAVRRLLTGSVSRGVVRRAPCSVLVVRRTLRDVRHMIIGFDGSPHARRTVDLIASLDSPRGGRVSLFTAVDAMHIPAQTLVSRDVRAAVAAEVARVNKQRRRRARKGLDRAARTLTAAGWKVDRIVTEGAPLQGLLATVAKKRADLLAVGARGVTGVRHLLLGSVAEGALNRSPVPVLIVR